MGIITNILLHTSLESIELGVIQTNTLFEVNESISRQPIQFLFFCLFFSFNNDFYSERAVFFS